MTAFKPEDRYQSPQAVVDGLLRHLKPILHDGSERSSCYVRTSGSAEAGHSGARAHRVLIVDDDPDVRELCRSLLSSETVQCEEAADGVLAMEALGPKPCDLVLLDIDMPRMGGREVLQRVRETPPCPHLKVVLFSGRASGDDMAELLLAGADDYLPKPFSVVQLEARVKTMLRLKDAQDRSDRLNQHLLGTNHELEQGLNARDISLVQIRNSLILSLSTLVEYRDRDSGQHLIRMQRYCRCLSEEACKSPPSTSRSTPISPSCWWPASPFTTSARRSCRITSCSSRANSIRPSRSSFSGTRSSAGIP